MFLERAEIRNFRGIRELKVDFEHDCTVLIGENSWGKSSLLRALWMVLGRGERLCKLAREDLYIPIPLLNENLDLPSDPDAPKENSVEIRKLTPLPPEKRPQLDFVTLTRRRRDSYISAIKKEAEHSSYYRNEYEFSSHDTFRGKAERIQIDLTFCEDADGGDLINLPELADCWTFDEQDGRYRIRWRIGAGEKNGSFTTRHEILGRGKWSQERTEKALLTLISLNPVLRVRDQRMNSVSPSDEDRLSANPSQIFESLENAFKRDIAIPASEMKRQLENLDELSKRYFGSYSSGGRRLIESAQGGGRNTDILGRPVSIEDLSSLKETMERPGINKVKILTTLLAGVVMSSKGGREISEKASPIIIFEDIEARFHPTLLLSFWSIVAAVGVQKIVTTNSGDLLSAIPLQSLRRLYRPYYDTRSYKVNLKSLSDDDSRRIAFHLRINRPMTFFARTWLLVEGETEIWVLSQVAAILGVSLQCDGIRPVEFAQCGLNPIMKVARQLGIAFYVLTDGDEAGNKYSDIVRGFLPGKSVDAHLTKLPCADIEHYLYFNGYDEVYLANSGIHGPLRKGTTADKIIEMALRRRTKPGMAVAVIEEMRRRGRQGVPPLLTELIEKVRTLSHGDYI